MGKKNTPDSSGKLLQMWTAITAIIIGGLLIGSWIVASQSANKRPPTDRTAALTQTVPQEIAKDVYIGYKDVVYKLSGRDGSVIWQHPLKQAYQPDRLIGSYMQVEVVDDVVYAAVEYGISALRGSDGKEIWHYRPTLTPAELAQDLGRIVEIFIDKSLMYVNYTRADVAALDLRNGSQKWSHLTFPNGGSFSVSNDTLYVSEFSTKGVPLLHAIDGATGTERWHFEREMWGNTSLSGAYVVDGVVYSSGNPLYALNARTGQKLWEQRLPDRSIYFDQLRLLNGVLYGSTSAPLALVSGQEIPPDIYRVYAFDAKTGKQLWHSSPGYSFLDGLVDGGKSVLIQANDVLKERTLQALDAKNGTLRWQISLVTRPCEPAGFCFAPQVYADGNQLYILDSAQPYKLQVFDVHTGKQVAQHPVSIPTKEGIGPSLLSNGVLYVRSWVHEGGAYISGSSNTFWHYVIYAIRLTNGATSWKYTIGSLLEYQDPISDLLLAP